MCVIRDNHFRFDAIYILHYAGHLSSVVLQHRELIKTLISASWATRYLYINLCMYSVLVTVFTHPGPVTPSGAVERFVACSTPRTSDGPNLIRANTWTNDGVLPLNAWKQTSVKLKSNCNYPYSKKCNWKSRLKDIGHFVQTSVFQLSIVKYCPDGECDHLKTFYTVHAYPGSCSFICCAVNWWYDKTCQ